MAPVTTTGSGDGAPGRGNLGFLLILGVVVVLLILSYVFPMEEPPPPSEEILLEPARSKPTLPPETTPPPVYSAPKDAWGFHLPLHPAERAGYLARCDRLELEPPETSAWPEHRAGLLQHLDDQDTTVVRSSLRALTVVGGISREAFRRLAWRRVPDVIATAIPAFWAGCRTDEDRRQALEDILVFLEPDPRTYPSALKALETVTAGMALEPKMAQRLKALTTSPDMP